MSNNCLIGKGVDFELVNAGGIEVANGAAFNFNVHRQNNTEVEIINRCGCREEFFIFNHLNSTAINLKRRGRYTFSVDVSGTVIAPATALVVAITDNEGNIEKIPFAALTGTVSGTVSMFMREKFTTIRLLNVSGAPLTLSTFSDEIPQVILTITYCGE